MLTSGAITHRIDELEKVSLVQRAPDPNDRRGIRVKLTNMGLTKINAAVAAHVENEGKVLQHLSAGERSLLASLLRRLLLGLEEQTRDRGEEDQESKTPPAKATGLLPIRPIRK